MADLCVLIANEAEYDNLEVYCMSLNNERIIRIIQIAVRILVLPVMCIVSYGTKSYVPLVLGAAVFIILLGITRIKLIGNRFQDSDEDKQTYRKIVIRSVILAPVITFAFIGVVLLLTLNV